MVNHVALAGLLLDIAGAILLARSLFFASPARYARDAAGRTFAHVAGHEPEKDADHAREWAEVRVGASLLVVGFVGQAIGTIESEWSAGAAVAAYLCAGCLVTAAVLLVRRLTRRRELAVFVAQLVVSSDARWRYNHWASYAQAYGRRGNRSRADLEAAIARAAAELGEHPWEGYEPSESDLSPSD